MQLANHSIEEISDALFQEELSSVELTKYAILRHKQFGSMLNAYKCWDAQLGLATAEKADEAFKSKENIAPLQGIPISVKDIYGLPGFPVFAGSYRQLPSNWEQGGPIIQALQQQLSVFLGKTHTVEFAYGGLGINNHWGTPRNPWDLKNHRVPGGSSSGAGVSLCEGSAFAALGSDTAGSVRIPASYTGNVGLKTSAGRWSTDGIVPLSPFMDTAGVLTRTVKDATYAFFAIDVPAISVEEHRKQLEIINEIQATNFRIGLALSGIMWTSAEQSIAKVCMNAVNALESDGCSTVSIDFPDAETAIEMRDRGGTSSVELIEFLQTELPEWLDNLGSAISERIKIGGNISAVEFLNRKRQINQARVNVLDKFSDCDVIASPTVPIAPPLLEEVIAPNDYMPNNLLALQNTSVGSYLNLCAITVPVGTDHLGMPVGLQIMAPAGNENTLLAIGQRLESILPKPELTFDTNV